MCQYQVIVTFIEDSGFYLEASSSGWFTVYLCFKLYRFKVSAQTVDNLVGLALEYLSGFADERIKTPNTLGS